uniref:hypothetical protein n=1 Tax=Cyanobium sp. TaxID=2164130 RepID=UPI00404B6910
MVSPALALPPEFTAPRLSGPRAWGVSVAGAGLGILLASLGTMAGAQAQSQLLESVKQNPALAKQLCVELRQMNGSGIASTSNQAIQTIAQQRQLSFTDAEVLTTYVVGLYCPDVR